jgi:hypothetical protein
MLRLLPPQRERGWSAVHWKSQAGTVWVSEEGWDSSSLSGLPVGCGSERRSADAPGGRLESLWGGSLALLGLLPGHLGGENRAVVQQGYGLRKMGIFGVER